MKSRFSLIPQIMYHLLFKWASFFASNKRANSDVEFILFEKIIVSRLASNMQLFVSLGRNTIPVLPAIRM